MGLLGHVQGQISCSLELTPLETGAAHRQGTDPLQGAFHGGGHGAGAEHVGAEVGAVVDARQHQIRCFVHQFAQGQLHAIGRCAAAGPGGHARCKQFVRPFGAQGGLQGQAVAGGGAFLVGADHRDLVTPGGRGRSQGADPLGEDPVVIADQDPHGSADGWGEPKRAGCLQSGPFRLCSVSAPVTLQQLTDQLDALEQQASAEIAEAADAAALEQLRVGLLGKKGRLSGVLGAMGKLPGQERPVVGQRANVLKTQVQTLLSDRLQAVQQAAMAERIARESIDVTAPPSGIPMGHRHPLITTTEEIVDLFLGLGYSVAEGPEVEKDHYNFTALNIPEDHPARDMQDTFYLGADLLMRTHTSPVQIRHLEQNPPPVRIVAPGRVYRRDAVDATHSPVFHQVEVLAIDEGLDFSHLRGTVMAFLKAFFGDLPVRFRASYFPFTEPSAEVDVQWRGRWLEVMGCGMVDPAVLEGLGLDPERYSGFAAGLGVERFCMVRHGIDDIRRLYTSDLRFLEQF